MPCMQKLSYESRRVKEGGGRRGKEVRSHGLLDLSSSSAGFGDAGTGRELCVQGAGVEEGELVGEI